VNLHFRRTDEAPASDAPVGTPIDASDDLEAVPDFLVERLGIAGDDVPADDSRVLAELPELPEVPDEPGRDEASALPEPVDEAGDDGQSWAAMDPADELPAPGSGLARPNGWSDPVTSADGPHYWDRLLSSERDRIRRYRRPATVVFIELVHLDELGALWGEDVAAQSLVRVGRTVMRQTRSSDHAARIDVARFGVFLPETNEIAAINFVERVRAAIDASLGLMAETVHVAIGWASPTDGNLDSALELAERRLAAELAAEL
jgi:diguanylate cyclase (GGDEF)-like protein